MNKNTRKPKARAGSLQRMVRPTGRCVVKPATLLRGVTIADAIVSALRDAGFPMPWAIYDSTPGVKEPEMNIRRRVNHALKECGATKLISYETQEGHAVFEWA